VPIKQPPDRFILFVLPFIPDDFPEDRNCECCVHCCFGYDSWLSFQYILYQIVKDPLFELFITLCIVLNTTFLALEHHGMSETVRTVLDIGNKVNARFPQPLTEQELSNAAV
jgi:hypothetical protein